MHGHHYCRRHQSMVPVPHRLDFTRLPLPAISSLIRSLIRYFPTAFSDRPSITASWRFWRRLFQEFAFGIDDRNFDVFKAGVIRRAIAELQATDIVVADAVQRLNEFGARDRTFAGGATQSFNHDLGGHEPFDRSIRKFDAGIPAH